MDFFSAAVEKAGTDDPKTVAFAMEGLELPTSNGDTRIMRAADHQLLIPLAIVELDDKVPNKILAWGKQLGVGWRTVGWISREKNTLPTACQMVRPSR
jgi:branched-chain amino acid transport system substrate-binding protein